MARNLTNAMRETVAGRVIRATFDAREKELKAAGVAFADKAYRLLVDEHFQAVADSLPREWFKRTESILISERIEQSDRSPYVMSYRTIEELLDRRYSRIEYFSMSRSQLFPYSAVDGYGVRLYVTGPNAEALRADYAAIEEMADAFLKERSALTERINGLLHSVRTVQRLVEVAPELKTYLPDEAFEERAPMPAPIVGTLITDLMKAGLQLSTVEA